MKLVISYQNCVCAEHEYDIEIAKLDICRPKQSCASYL